MKTRNWQKVLVVLAVVASGATAMAQDSSAPNAGQPAMVSQPAPRLGYGASQVLKLAQAKLGDDTILAYIRNSGNG